MIHNSRKFLFNVIILGPAGSGKTTLASGLGSWISKNTDLRVGYVNLDPAADLLPYKPDVDVRKYVDAFKLMREEGLGPNAAIVKSIDMISFKVNSLLSELARMDADVLLIDTPGQSEVFVFRDSGPSIVDSLRSLGRTIGVYVYDASLRLGPLESVITYLMSLVIQLRLGIITLPIMNKVDLLPINSYMYDGVLHMELERIKDRLTSVTGVMEDITSSLLNDVLEYLPSLRILKVSAKTGEGLDALFKYIHETACTCGDLT